MTAPFSRTAVHGARMVIKLPGMPIGGSQEKGSARWDGEASPVLEIKDQSKPAEFILPVRIERADNRWNGQEGHAGCLDEMFAALKENRLAETDCRDNIKSMEMVFGALESAKTGKKVTLSL